MSIFKKEIDTKTAYPLLKESVEFVVSDKAIRQYEEQLDSLTNDMPDLAKENRQDYIHYMTAVQLALLSEAWREWIYQKAKIEAESDKTIVDKYISESDAAKKYLDDYELFKEASIDHVDGTYKSGADAIAAMFFMNMRTLRNNINEEWQRMNSNFAYLFTEVIKEYFKGFESQKLIK